MLFKGKLKGTLKVIRELNRGAEGIVYLCEDVAGEKITTKRYFNDQLPLMNREVYFHKTIMSHERFLHPVDIGSIDDNKLETHNSLVFPYIAGGDGFNFIEYFARSGHYDTKKAQEFLLEHCMEFWKTLHICHERNVCHWDIKPINILIDNYEVSAKKKKHNMFLIDFGLSSSAQYIYKTAPSRTYSAPEVLASERRRPITYRCDVWSAGVSWLTLALGHEGTITYGYGDKLRKEGYKFLETNIYSKDKLIPGMKKILEASLSPDPRHRACADEIYTI